MISFETTLLIAGVSLVVGGLIAWGITHWYYLKQKKDSDQQIRSLMQQIKRLEETLTKVMNALSEDVKKSMMDMVIALWGAKLPDQPITPPIKRVFVGIVKKTATAIKNYNYTAKGGIKLWGPAGTIIEVPEGEIPPIIDTR